MLILRQSVIKTRSINEHKTLDFGAVTRLVINTDEAKRKRERERAAFYLARFFLVNQEISAIVSRELRHTPAHHIESLLILLGSHRSYFIPITVFPREIVGTFRKKVSPLKRRFYDYSRPPNFFHNSLLLESLSTYINNYYNYV